MDNLQTETNCPICNGEYHRTDLTEDICIRHQDWFVSKCINCGKPCLTDMPGICINCQSHFRNTASLR